MDRSRFLRPTGLGANAVPRSPALARQSPAADHGRGTPHPRPWRRWQGPARRTPPIRLVVDPDVLHALATGDAVDHDRQPFHIGLPAAAASIVKEIGRAPSSASFRSISQQVACAFPDWSQRNLNRSARRLRTAVAVIIQIPAAPIEQRKVLIGIEVAPRRLRPTT